MMRGQLGNAIATCGEALVHAQAYVQQVGRPLPVHGYALLRQGGLLYERNEVERALEFTRRGLAQVRQWGQADILALGHATLARCLWATGDVAGARREYAEAARLVRGLSRRAWVSMTAWEARLQLQQGDVAAASRWADESVLDVKDERSFLSADIHHTRARVLAAQGRFDAAQALLKQVLETAETVGAGASIVETRILQAVLFQTQGRMDRALETLDPALVRAAPEGYVRTFVDEGAPMVRLLEAALDRGIAPRYTRALLAALTGDLHERGPGAALRRAGIEPLSERELEVLRLLPTALSRPEIAERLYISPNTVRFHLKNIYNKLGVHTRADAIARAQALELL
jgi:LuxR family maltose regulon positive regulatory protein